MQYLMMRRLPRPRILKSHECFQPQYPRIIYIVRDPRDICVSFYHPNLKWGIYRIICDSYYCQPGNDGGCPQVGGFVSRRHRSAVGSSRLVRPVIRWRLGSSISYLVHDVTYVSGQEADPFL